MSLSWVWAKPKGLELQTYLDTLAITLGRKSGSKPCKYWGFWGFCNGFFNGFFNRFLKRVLLMIEHKKPVCYNIACEHNLIKYGFTSLLRKGCVISAFTGGLYHRG